MTQKKPYSRFTEMVTSECKRNGVKLGLRKGKFVRLGGFKCSGYFGDDPPRLIASMGHPDSKTILAHEFCHMTQWIDGISLWTLGEKGIEEIDNWLLGKDVDDIDLHIANSRSLELDNEIRTSRLVEEYDLGMDVDLYIKKSNAYVLFYNWLRETRRWSKPGNSPYMNKRILSMMSN